MSYLMQFPSLPLPHDIRSPPYVVFGLNGKSLVAELPPRIPLKIVLHFAPKLQQWVLPPPLAANLPWSSRRLELCSSFIGIDIYSDDIKIIGLKWIIHRMLQASGATYPGLFLMHPTTLAAISIHKTWLALGLPRAGIQCLSTHIRHNISFGSVVNLVEMKAIWDNFPRDSDVVNAMGENFVRAFLNDDYGYFDLTAIRDWYYSCTERRKFFSELEAKYPPFHEALRLATEVAVSRPRKMEQKAKEKEQKEASKRGKKVLGKKGTRVVSAEERRELHKKCEAALQSRLRRTKSDDSIRSVETVIWNPTASKGEDDNGSGTKEEEKNGTDVKEDEDKAAEDIKTPTQPSRPPAMPWLQAKGKSVREPQPNSEYIKFMRRVNAMVRDPTDSYHPSNPSNPKLMSNTTQPGTQAASQPSSTTSVPQATTSSTTIGNPAWAKSLAARIKMSVKEVEAIRSAWETEREEEDEETLLAKKKLLAFGQKPDGDDDYTNEEEDKKRLLVRDTRDDGRDGCVGKGKEGKSRTNLDYMEFD